LQEIQVAAFVSLADGLGKHGAVAQKTWRRSRAVYFGGVRAAERQGSSSLPEMQMNPPRPTSISF
jgi:hypothetical protein